MDEQKMVHSVEISDEVKQLDYETALTKIDEVLKQLESGGISLEESIALYQKGFELSVHCVQLLENAQMRVNILMADDRQQPFDAQEADE